MRKTGFKSFIAVFITTLLKRRFPIGVLCCGTVFSMNSDQNFFKLNLKVLCGIIAFE